MIEEVQTGAPIAPGADAIERLEADLNPAQKRAVEYGEGPLLVVAGAGSGKTRVLTRRIAYLIATGQARPSEILAITFTNKAAEEMRNRVSELVGGVSRLMWVMTFHSACARILRANAERLGYKKAFTIYDQSDSLRMVKRCMDELDVDSKRFTPRSIQNAISGAKNRLEDSTDYGAKEGGYFEHTVSEVYNLYERRMLEASAMDFDDLLVRTVNLLELFADVRERYQRTFRWVLVDEYQDTNRAQYRLLQLLSEEHGNLTVVGDEDQCLVEGTMVRMADGSERAIEEVREGDEVLSAHGSGAMRGSRVLRVRKSVVAKGVEIRTRDGRRIVSTPEHIHFAGLRRETTPDMHLTYVMRRAGKGFRVGVTRTFNHNKRLPVSGVAVRSRQEHADGAWIVGAYDSDAEARTQEAILAAKYSLPMIPFVARHGRGTGGVVSNQVLIDEVFMRVDSDEGGYRLLEERGLAPCAPHYQPQSHEGLRRCINLTMCGGHRHGNAMHTVAVGGRDPDARATLESIGLNIRPAKRGSLSWRYESAFASLGAAMDVVGRIQEVLPCEVRRTARLGERSSDPGRKNSLPLLAAGSVTKGMAVFTEDGCYDVVESVRRVVLDRPVYDIDVERTHNFIANGLITHNSVYSFRAADVRNILDFDKDFPEAEVVKLEQNYRSTQKILDAANAVVANNRDRREKHLFTDAGQGEPVRVYELDDEHAEARFVAGEVERLVADEGFSRSDVAVFYRVNSQSRVLEDTLVRYEIPYQVIGGTKFYDRSEIKDAVAYLSLLANPADAISLQRVINSPRRGIGQTTQARLLSFANTTGEDVWDVAARPESVPGLGSAAVRSVARFAAIMKGLRARAEDAPVAEVLEAVLHDSGYIESLQAERTVEAEGRIENLEELVGVAAEFDANRAVEGPPEGPALDEFLARISLYSDQDSLKDTESLVTLMSLHTAKGLEYRAVFVIGCEEGVFPHSRSVEEGNIEEERRLFYVGVTRARERLYMACARRRSLHGGSGWNLPSRFLGELPPELVERHSTAARTGWSDSGSQQSFGSGRGFGGGGGAFSAGSRKQPQEPEAQFRIGDDVIHASFGEGVVTSVEPGGVIVVRFSGGGGERKLMADYAPLRKAS